MKYEKLTFGQIEAGIDIIGGEEAFVNLLRGKLKVVPKNRNLKRWATIKLGTGLRTLEDFLNAFKSNNKHMSNSLQKRLIERGFTFKVVEKETKIDLCVDTVFNLTGQVQTTVENLHRCIHDIGGELLSVEAAFQLRLQDNCIEGYDDYFIAMDGVCVGDYVSAFSINNRESDTISPLRLDSWGGHRLDIWDGERRIVFVKPRPKPLKATYLFQRDGTLTRSKKVVKQLIAKKLLWQTDKTIHLDLMAFDPNCVCCFGGKISKIKYLVEDLKKFFKADEVVFHHETGRESYTFFDATDMQRTNNSCSEYPEIKGIGMRWEVKKGNK